MPRNGSGTYVPPAGNPVAPGQTIQSVWANDLVNDMGNEITGSLPRNGAAPMTQQLKLIAGSSSVPGLGFNSEPSTGWYWPGAGLLAATVTGIETIRLTSNGSLLVGTTTDTGTHKLQVTGNTALTGTLSVSGLASFPGTITGNVAIATTTSNVRLTVDRLGNGTQPTFTTGVGAAFVSGGTSASPNYVAITSGNAAPAALFFGDTDADGVGRVYYDNTSNFLSLWTNAAERARVDSSGNLMIGTTAAGGRLTATDAGTSGAATTLAVFGTVAAAVAGTESRIFLIAGEGTARSTFIGGLNTGGANNAHAMTFGVSAPTSAPVECMRLTSNGLLIGNTDGATPLEVTTSSSARGITIRGRSADNISGLDFYSNDGSTSYSYIQGRVNGDTRYGARTDSGFHAFYTGASLTERMRVNNTSFTTTVPINAGGLITGQSGTAAQAFATFDASGTLGTLSLRNGSTSRSGYVEFFDPGATRQGYIGYSQTTASTDAGTINYVGGVHAFNGAVQIATGGLRIGSSSLITRFESAEQTTPTASAVASIAHGGTRTPDLVQCFLRCKTAELGYAVGDEVIFNLQNANTTRDFLIGANATNVFFRWDRGGSDLPALRNYSTGVWSNITTANWRLVFKAHWL